MPAGITVVRNLSKFLSTIFGVVVLVFITTRVLPGTALDLLGGENISAIEYQRLEAQLHLNEPIYKQLYIYFCDLIKFDFGTSAVSKKPIRDLILSAIANTGLLSISALGVGILFGNALALITYFSKTLTALGRLLSLIIYGVPIFVIGIFTTEMFGMRSFMFPIYTAGTMPTVRELILPTVTLSSGLLVAHFLFCHDKLSELISQPFVTVAYAKGLNRWQVLTRHLLPNLKPAILSLTRFQLTHLLTGALVTETMFGIRGLGFILYRGILERDYAVVQACAIWFGLVYSATRLFFAASSGAIRREHSV